MSFVRFRVVGAWGRDRARVERCRGGAPDGGVLACAASGAARSRRGHREGRADAHRHRKAACRTVGAPFARTARLAADREEAVARGRLVTTAAVYGRVEAEEKAASDDVATNPSSQVRNAGLLLGDRFCLALARRVAAPKLTPDRAWMKVTERVGVEVQLVRWESREPASAPHRRAQAAFGTAPFATGR